LEDAGDKIMQALIETELSWAEKIELEGKIEGKIEGKVEGKVEGKLELLLRMFRMRFGKLPAEFEQQLRAIDDPAVLDELSEQVLTAVTLADVHFPT
jgi:predicted transposase YdaD